MHNTRRPIAIIEYNGYTPKCYIILLMINYFCTQFHTLFGIQS